MASWNWPALKNSILSDIPGIRTLLLALFKQDPTGTTDVPAGAKRWTDTPEGKQFQNFTGSEWQSVGKLAHDAASVDGHSASTGTTANTIPVRDASGKLPGDITGNAATASKAAALSATNPIATGGTGATTVEQARENLGVAPKNHASSSREFGAGSSTQYGHLMSHDAPDATKTAAAGHALSPAGAKTALDKKMDTSGGAFTGQVQFAGASTSSDGAAAVFPGKFRGVVTKMIDGSEYADWNVQDKNGNPIANFRFYDNDTSVKLEVSPQASSMDKPWPGPGLLLEYIKATGEQIARISGRDIAVSGGAINTLQFKNNWGAISRTANDGYLELRGGKPEDKSGASIALFGEDHSGWDAGPGGVSLAAEAGDNKANWFFRTDGKLQMRKAGTSVETILTSAGGNVGKLHYTSNNLVRTDNDNYLRIWGSRGENNDGANITLFGKDHSSGWGAGGGGMLIYLPRGDGTNESLYFQTNGEHRTGNGKFVICTHSWSDDNGNWYHKYSDGWLVQGGFNSGGTYRPTVTLHLPMRDTKYHIGTTHTFGTNPGNVSSVCISPELDTITTTSFVVAGRSGQLNSSEAAFYWKVEGYAAS